MNTILVPIDTVIPYDRNPRHNHEGVASVAKSLQKFGWQQPIVVDKNNVIIAGHTRLLAAKDLGMTEVPVVVADLSEAKAKAYRIADNKVAEHSSWDVPLLELELTSVQSDLGDISLTDFTWSDVELLKDPVALENDIRPTKKSKKAPLVFKVGEVWSFGGNEMTITNAEMSDALSEAAKVFEEYSLIAVTQITPAETTPE